MHSFKNGFGKFILCFVFILLVMMFFVPVGSSASLEDYRDWSQASPEWGDIVMGNGGVTVRSSGCALTSLAIMAAHTGAVPAEIADVFTPGYLATYFNENGGFTSGGALTSWSMITDVIPAIKFVGTAGYYKMQSVTKSDKIAEIKTKLDEGYQVLANVGGHWVYVEKIVGETVFMIDPAKSVMTSNTDMYAKYNYENTKELRLFTVDGTVVTSATTAPATTTTAETVTYTAGIYKISAISLRYRTEPNKNAEIIGYLPDGGILVVTEVCDGWGKINYNGKDGWFFLSYAQIAIDNEFIVVAEDGANVFALPDIKSDVLMTVPQDYIAKVITVENGYCKTAAGYIKLTDLIPVTVLVNHIKGDINGDGVVDEQDLAVLNMYLLYGDVSGDSFSLLNSRELKAADINGDGIIDYTDAIYFIMMFCLT